MESFVPGLTETMEFEQVQILEALLTRLLCLKDADFLAFLKLESSKIKPFIKILCALWTSDYQSAPSCHIKFLKLLLRLCPAYNSIHRTQKGAKAVIAPKQFVAVLFELDPVGLATYLYDTWKSSAPELLQIIRDELFPQALIEQLKKCAGSNNSDSVNQFLNWSCNINVSATDLTGRERESILKRFEYESDDDLVDEVEGQAEGSKTRTFDPVQTALYRAYLNSPEVFSRTSAVRQGKARKTLCDLTKLSHEQIEGWAVMLERNPRKQRILQDFVIFSDVSAK